MSANHTIETRVRFDSGANVLAGSVFRPANAPTDVPLPGIVVTGTWTSVRQQMADRYACAVAARGFTALSFDFSGWGESTGAPRDHESPTLKIADINHAVSYLAGRADVATEAIGALGVCASAGYTAMNAAHDPRVKALALIAPWLHDTELLEQIYGGADGVSMRLRAGQTARTKYESEGIVDYVPAVSADDPMAAMPMHIDFYENPQRGAIPAWPNRFAVMSWVDWLEFDPIARAPEVTTPTLIVHSEQAAIPAGAHRFLAGLPQPATALWTDGEQFDFYDQPTHVTRAVDAAVSHFGSVLGATPHQETP